MSTYHVKGPRGGNILLDAPATRVAREWEGLVRRFGKISIEPYVPAPLPPPSPLLRPLVWVDDEIARSSEPPRHASDLAATLVRNRITGVLIKVSDTPEQWAAALYLREACRSLGLAFGTWDDANLEPARVLTIERAWGSTMHVAQVESPAQDAAWEAGTLSGLPADRGVVFTEGAWGRDAGKAARWLNAGFKAMPEAALPDNPNATIGAMLDLAVNALRWPYQQVAPVCYLTKDTAAARYSTEIGAVGPRWSLFRYGDIDQTDWDTVAAWGR